MIFLFFPIGTEHSGQTQNNHRAQSNWRVWGCRHQVRGHKIPPSSPRGCPRWQRWRRIGRTSGRPSGSSGQGAPGPRCLDPRTSRRERDPPLHEGRGGGVITFPGGSHLVRGRGNYLRRDYPRILPPPLAERFSNNGQDGNSAPEFALLLIPGHVGVAKGLRASPPHLRKDVLPS